MAKNYQNKKVKLPLIWKTLVLCSSKWRALFLYLKDIIHNAFRIFSVSVTLQRISVMNSPREILDKSYPRWGRQSALNHRWPVNAYCGVMGSKIAGACINLGTFSCNSYASVTRGFFLFAWTIFHHEGD